MSTLSKGVLNQQKTRGHGRGFFVRGEQFAVRDYGVGTVAAPYPAYW